MIFRIPSTNATWSLAYPTATSVVNAISDLLDKPSTNRYESLEIIFAGLSVLIACIALVVGIIQVRKHQRASLQFRWTENRELETGLPQVI